MSERDDMIEWLRFMTGSFWEDKDRAIASNIIASLEAAERQAKAAQELATQLRRCQVAFLAVLQLTKTGDIKAVEQWAVDNGLIVPGTLGEDIAKTLAAFEKAGKE